MLFDYFRLYKSPDKLVNLNERFAWYTIGIGGIIAVGMNSGYFFMGVAFSRIPIEYQWLLALASPLIREFWVKYATKACLKASGMTEESGSALEFTKYLGQHYVKTKHAVFLAVILGGVATPETTYCLVCMDLLINAFKSIQTIRHYGDGNTGKILTLIFKSYESFLKACQISLNPLNETILHL